MEFRRPSLVEIRKVRMLWRDGEPLAMIARELGLPQSVVRAVLSASETTRGRERVELVWQRTRAEYLLRLDSSRWN